MGASSYEDPRERISFVSRGSTVFLTVSQNWFKSNRLEMEIDAQHDPQRLSVAFRIQSECFLLQSITRSLAWCPKCVIFTLELAHSALTVLHYCWNHESGLWTAAPAPVSSAVKVSWRQSSVLGCSSNVFLLCCVRCCLCNFSLTNVRVL